MLQKATLQTVTFRLCIWLTKLLVRYQYFYTKQLNKKMVVWSTEPLTIIKILFTLVKPDCITNSFIPIKIVVFVYWFSYLWPVAFELLVIQTKKFKFICSRKSIASFKDVLLILILSTHPATFHHYTYATAHCLFGDHC